MKDLKIMTVLSLCISISLCSCTNKDATIGIKYITEGASSESDILNGDNMPDDSDNSQNLIEEASLEADEKNSGTVNNKESNIDEKKKEVAENLMSEYQNIIGQAEKNVNAFLDALNNGDSETSDALYTDATYDLLMAYSKFYGISGVYKFYFTDQEISDLSLQLKSITKISISNIIHFGYSKNGLYFIAIEQPLSNADFECENVISKIRSDENETYFLSDLEYSVNEGHYAIDIYVEDLTDCNSNNIYNVDDITITEEGKISHIISEKLNDSDLNNILEEYNRNIEWNKTLVNKGWKTFLFDMGEARSPEIIIKYQGEDIVLQ